jgi:hypothetical protein
MMHTARRLAICVLLVSMAAISVRGQSSLVGGPSLGFSSNADGSVVWPIIGIPGASLLGRRLAFGVNISAAEISSQHDYLVAIRSEDSQPVISRLASGTIAPSPIEGTRPGRTVFAISPLGGALGVFNQDAKTCRFFGVSPPLQKWRLNLTHRTLPVESRRWRSAMMHRWHCWEYRVMASTRCGL